MLHNKDIDQLILGNFQFYWAFAIVHTVPILNPITVIVTYLMQNPTS